MQVVAAANPFAAAAEAGRPPGGGVEIVLERHGAPRAGATAQQWSACGSRVAVRVQAGFDRQTLADVLAVLEA